jgi:hypothetical protein
MKPLWQRPRPKYVNPVGQVMLRGTSGVANVVRENIAIAIDEIRVLGIIFRCFRSGFFVCLLVWQLIENR